MSKSTTVEKIPHSAVIEPTLNLLVANLIGDESRLHEMGENRIFPDEISEYTMQGRILEIMYFLDAYGQPPTGENIKASLAAANQPEVAEFVDTLMAYQSDDRDVMQPAFIIKRIYVIKRNMILVHEEFGELLNAPMGLPSDQVQYLMNKLQNIIEQASKERPRHITSVAESYDAMTRELYEKQQSGLPAGPSWPWQGLRNLVPVIRRGNLVSLMGKSKWGKTTVGTAMAEHWAWVQGYRVYIYAFETSEQEYYERQVANHCFIPTWYARTGQWDKDNPELAANKAYQRFIDTKLAGGLIGDIIFQKAAGWNMTLLKAAIIEHERKAKQDNIECVHLIDYYQLIDTKEYRHENVPLNRVAQELKILAAKENLYLMTLVQEQEASDDGRDDRKYPKDGNEIIKSSQVFMRLHRTIADRDFPVKDERGQSKDTIGNLRWFHKVGELDSRMQIQVTHANSDRKGDVDLLAEMAYFRIKEPPPNVALTHPN